MKEIYCLFVLSIFIFVSALSIAGYAACRCCNFCWEGQFLFCFLFVFVFVHLHWVFIFAYLHWIYIFVYLLLVPIFVYLHWVFIFVYLRIYFCLFTLSIAGDSAAGYSLFAFAFVHLHWVFIFVYLHQVVLKIVQLVGCGRDQVSRTEWVGRCPTQPEPPLFVLVLVYLYFFVYFCVSVSLCLVVNGEVWPPLLPACPQPEHLENNKWQQGADDVLSWGFQDLTFTISFPKM